MSTAGDSTDYDERVMKELGERLAYECKDRIRDEQYPEYSCKQEAFVVLRVEESKGRECARVFGLGDVR